MRPVFLQPYYPRGEEPGLGLVVRREDYVPEPARDVRCYPRLELLVEAGERLVEQADGRAAAPTTPWLPCAKGAVSQRQTEGLSVLFPLFRRGGIVNGHMQSNKPIFPIRILRFPAKHIFSYVVHPPYAALHFSVRAYICRRRTAEIMIRR